MLFIPKCKIQLEPSETIADIAFDITKGKQIALVSEVRRMTLLRYSPTHNTTYKNHALILREPNRALVADLADVSCSSVQTGQQIVGADIFEDTLAVWSWREAHIFRNDSKQNWIRSKVIKLEKSPVPKNSACMCKCIYILSRIGQGDEWGFAGQVVALCSGLILQSFGKTLTATDLLDDAHRSVAFSSTETVDVGCIVDLCGVSNGVVGALSHRGFIRLWQLSGQEIKPYGSMNNCRRIDCSPFADDPVFYLTELEQSSVST